jgi:uncharacterized protein
VTANELLMRVKRDVLALEPEAHVILYGSRARGDATEDSDWDLLVLVDGKVDHPRTDRIRHQLYELEWETGEVLSVIVRNRGEWDRFPYRAMPIHQRIAAEGICL